MNKRILSTEVSVTRVRNTIVDDLLICTPRHVHIVNQYDNTTIKDTASETSTLWRLGKEEENIMVLNQEAAWWDIINGNKAGVYMKKIYRIRIIEEIIDRCRRARIDIPLSDLIHLMRIRQPIQPYYLEAAEFNAQSMLEFVSLDGKSMGISIEMRREETGPVSYIYPVESNMRSLLNQHPNTIGTPFHNWMNTTGSMEILFDETTRRASLNKLTPIGRAVVNDGRGGGGAYSYDHRNQMKPEIKVKTIDFITDLCERAGLKLHKLDREAMARVRELSRNVRVYSVTKEITP